MQAHWSVRRFTADRLAAGLLFIGVATIACLMPAQNDTWWHLRAGYDMLRSHSVLLTDTFSHTVYGQAWPNYEWLTEVLFAAVHQVGGMPLLTAVCAASVVGGVWLTFAATRGDLIERCVLIALVVAGSTLTWSIRPQAFTLLMLGATVYLTTRRTWWPLPLVFLIWANLHGAVALGGLVLVGMLIGEAWAHRRLPRDLIVWSALCGLATLLTPLGLQFWPEILASLRRSRFNDISEWRPPALPPDNLVFWATAAALIVLAWRRRDRLSDAAAAGLIVSAVLALVLATRSMRNISPFLMIAAPALGALITRPRHVRRVPDTLASQSRGVVHALLLAVALIGATLTVARAWREPLERLDWHPISSAAASAIEGCPGPIYNRYVDGGPIAFFAPGQRVLLDSRQDPYPSSLVQKQFDVEATGNYRRLFARYGIQCAVIPPDSRTVDSLLRDGWSKVFADSRWVVLEDRRR